MKYVVLIGLGVVAGAVVTSGFVTPGWPYYAVSASVLIAASGYAAGSVIAALRTRRGGNR